MIRTTAGETFATTAAIGSLPVVAVAAATMPAESARATPGPNALLNAINIKTMEAASERRAGLMIENSMSGAALRHLRSAVTQWLITR
ncbi:hypothetical protein [Rhodopila sp.]|uniref:hypothetical protein n=1 Tax=Rhodopila sp. TaxID=2480087 RepID=UPI003D141503